MVERSSPSDLRNNRRTAGSATSRSATSGVQRRQLVPPEKVRRQRGQILITLGGIYVPLDGKAKRPCRRHPSGERENPPSAMLPPRNANAAFRGLLFQRGAPASVLQRAVLAPARAQLSAASRLGRPAQSARRDDSGLRGDSSQGLGRRAGPVRSPQLK